MKSESLSFQDRFGILLEKRLSSVAGLKYTILYGKSQRTYTPILTGHNEMRKFRLGNQAMVLSLGNVRKVLRWWNCWW
jgi:hypothetical protein